MSHDEYLWTAIYGLYSLLINKVNCEEEYQSYFEKNPVAFDILNLNNIKSFEKSSSCSLPFDDDRGFTPEPDFIGIENTSCRVSIVELKTPFVGDITTSRADGNRAKFKAFTESFISQATEYAESIRDRSEARDIIKSEFGIEKISDYKIYLICGLKTDNDPRLVATLTSQRKIPTEIVFYDDLLERMIDKYSFSRKDIFSRQGWCFVFHIILQKEQSNYISYLGEYGAANKDRVSVLLERGNLIFECLDSEGKPHRLQSKIESMQPQYVRFEFSNDENGIYMSLNVNNIEQDLRVGRSKLRLTPDTAIFTLGANSRGESGAHFLMLEHYSVGRTMDLSEKLGSFHYFQKKTNGTPQGLEFKPESYMVRLPSGHLSQDVEHLKPVLNVWASGGTA